ncbi:VIT family protein [Zhongshania sp.]|jgi:VIT1/CCC1 family predicted Fe2+/Mn2+ transporter|uniref:VIT1/CCC1 transporter family protein n=1 Tax=Zhongshania sp. TaxID=1971902 RepID=UPI001B45BC6A|nr:VIT family protein [Zhongshania sp.]MBQ0796220.1 VIT family protein [Zhongshania sp.]
MTRRHFEQHFTKRTGWLRAAVLGANDGIISTASLIIGIAAANASHNSILLTGFAGLVAGAMSMAAGEYVSVSSQADIERADLNREKQELENTPEHEHQELTNIYIQRGLDITLAAQVATQLMDRDALGSHAHDELGMSETRAARPVQAALVSAAMFALGAGLPLVIAVATPLKAVPSVVGIGSLILLSLLGCLSAYAGGANRLVSAVRVTFWGALAMTITATAGKLFGSAM